MARAGDPRDPQKPLRQRAEAVLRRRRGPARPAAGTDDLRRTIHELEVHRVELEMQNRELVDAQATLSAARDRYASLFDLAPVGYLLLDESGTILAANDAACGLLARPRHRVLRRALAAFITPSDRSRLARHLAEAAGTSTRTRPLRIMLEGAPVRVVRVETVSEARPDGGPSYRTTMIDITDQVQGERQLRAERAALERSQATLRELARQLMSAEEGERRRIAADLHDDIGQRLHAIQVDLELLGRRASGRPGSSRAVRSLHRQVGEIINDLEGLAQALHPKIVEDLGLRVALAAHARNVERRTGLAVRFRERGVPAALPADVAICLYRVAQEALHNAHRHAGTKAVVVTLARIRGGLGLCVADRGRGFDAERARQTGRGLGLVTMSERVGAMGGGLRLRTNPGAGTHVHAWVPLP